MGRHHEIYHFKGFSLQPQLLVWPEILYLQTANLLENNHKNAKKPFQFLARSGKLHLLKILDKYREEA